MSEVGDLLIAFDIGTTALKVGLFSTGGDLLCLETREQPLEKHSSGKVEQPALGTWGLMKDAVNKIMQGYSSKDVVAISISVQRGTVVPLDGEGKPLTNQIVWMDNRGIPYTEVLRNVIGEEEYYCTAGHGINHITGISKLLWMQGEAEGTWHEARVVSSPQTLFLKWLGCEEFVCDLSAGAYLFPFDIEEKTWDEDLAAQIGYPIEKLPKLVTAVEVVGKLSKRAAKELGLRPGISLVAGGGDGQCAAAGSDVLESGLCMVNIGTAAGVQVHLSEVKRDQNLVLNCSGHVDPEAWEMEGHTQASGSVLRWFRDEFGGVEKAFGGMIKKDAYDLLVDQAKPVPPGSDGLLFLPTFMGSTAPQPNADAKGVLAGLTLGHTRDYVIRSLLEGVSLEIRWMLDAIVNTGVAVDEIRLVGGGSKNEFWNQIHADVFGRPIRTIEVNDAALVGASMCAAVAMGYYRNLQDAAQHFVRIKETIYPIEKNVSRYQDVYENYRDLFMTLHYHYF